MTSAILLQYDAQAGNTGGSLRKPGAAISVLIHGAALLAIWGWSGRTVQVAPPLAVVELIRLQAEPRQELVPPKPEPKKAPVELAPPTPVAQTVPVPKTVETSAAKAETYTPPAAPVHAEAIPVLPVTPVAATPAPAQAPAPAPTPVAATPKQISNEGIPTDYVNQVYARINSNTDYPREAKIRRQQGKVGYKLTLNPAGALISFDIQSSGLDVLDEAAREAIRRAAPFPRLPDLGGSSYLLAGNIIFKIN
ncbi:TonB family protein [Undibacterium sp. CY18W]|uniref:TonB family protein n=1 Tax=Undibacterium hunanense TaxID=2762292 RepID=A0ABR6ZQ18_9BURK|nr:TonB family protein [Undibacterium hunanense]MBC3917967.1 TonB family protein [Undibacterium hunanense]